MNYLMQPLGIRSSVRKKEKRVDEPEFRAINMMKDYRPREMFTRLCA